MEKKITPQQALENLELASKLAKLTFDEHVAIQNSLKVIADLILSLEKTNKVVEKK